MGNNFTNMHTQNSNMKSIQIFHNMTKCLKCITDPGLPPPLSSELTN